MISRRIFPTLSHFVTTDVRDLQIGDCFFQPLTESQRRRFEAGEMPHAQIDRLTMTVISHPFQHKHLGAAVHVETRSQTLPFRVVRLSDHKPAYILDSIPVCPTRLADWHTHAWRKHCAVPKFYLTERLVYAHDGSQHYDTETDY